MKNEKYYRINNGSHSLVPYVIFGIVVFAVVFFPFFAVNIKFQVGAIFLKIFDTIGMISLTLGGILVTLFVLSVFTRGPMNIRVLVIGIALLWVGSWSTGAAINFFGIQIGQQQPPPGYH